MAFPILLLLVLLAVIALFAWKREMVIKGVVELVIDVLLGILFTAILYILIPLPNNVVVLVVIIIALIFFAVHIYGNQSKPKQPNLR